MASTVCCNRLPYALPHGASYTEMYNELTSETDTFSRQVIYDLSTQMAPGAINICCGKPNWEADVRNWVLSSMKVSDLQVRSSFNDIDSYNIHSPFFISLIPHMLNICLNWWTPELRRNFFVTVLHGIAMIYNLDEDTTNILLAKTNIDKIMDSVGRARRASQIMSVALGDRLCDLWGGLVRVNSALSASLLEDHTHTETSLDISGVHHSLRAGIRRGQDHLFGEYFCNCCNTPSEPPQTNPELRIYGSEHRHSGRYILQKGGSGLLCLLIIPGYSSRIPTQRTFLNGKIQQKIKGVKQNAIFATEESPPPDFNPNEATNRSIFIEKYDTNSNLMRAWLDGTDMTNALDDAYNTAVAALRNGVQLPFWMTSGSDLREPKTKNRRGALRICEIIELDQVVVNEKYCSH
jgi:hypothetical protein